MTKIIEYLQFLALMVPTLLVLAAIAVSMAGLSLPGAEGSDLVAAAVLPYDAVWTD
jgi:hypothetical protein